ncbi:MAG: hypothetical protein HPY76_09360 [Anaerolineae bacterium]|jgi:hypothetical protein|nr:hypothetical protein [Anaerolineae bacterium]
MPPIYWTTVFTTMVDEYLKACHRERLALFQFRGDLLPRQEVASTGGISLS